VQRKIKYGYWAPRLVNLIVAYKTGLKMIFIIPEHSIQVEVFFIY